MVPKSVPSWLVLVSGHSSLYTSKDVSARFRAKDVYMGTDIQARDGALRFFYSGRSSSSYNVSLKAGEWYIIAPKR